SYHSRAVWIETKGYRLLSKSPIPSDYQQMNSKKRNTAAVILARARSGTTLLREVLNSHPEIRSCDEVFHPKTVELQPPWPTYHVFRKKLILEHPEYIVPTR